MSEREFWSLARDTILGSRMPMAAEHIHHGDTSVLHHSVAVAYYGWKLARALGIAVREQELVRGALLHDYFLYDWHDAAPGSMHGITHPLRALHNAERDFSLSDRERKIIGRHMFPLTPLPPSSREAAIVCLVDKACAIYESLRPNAYRKLRSAVLVRK